MKTTALIGIIVLITVLSIGSVAIAEAKPAKNTETFDNTIELGCSENNGILRCTLTTVQGNTIQALLSNPTGNPLCDEDGPSKRINLTNRQSENCSFGIQDTLRIIVLEINNVPLDTQPKIDITNMDGTIQFVYSTQ